MSAGPAGGGYPLTPSQTVGPFFAIGLDWPADRALAVPADDPEGIWLRGAVFDGQGRPVPDALVETWQAGPDGHFDHPDDPGRRSGGFHGFGRCGTDEGGRYAIRTRKPGPVPGPDGRTQAPHIDVCLFARGLLDRLVTRMYFADEAPANAADPLLGSLDADLRGRLVARPTADGYHFDIHLRGDDECVFFRL